MTLGERIESRIRELKITQSELARRAKLPQTTINSLIRGGRRSSPHLMRIARELQTTPEYLIGETDDPERDLAEPPLTSEQRDLVECFDELSRVDQVALLQIAKSLAGKGKSTTVHAPRIGFRGQD